MLKTGGEQIILVGTVLTWQNITSEAWSVLIHCFVTISKIFGLLRLQYCLLWDHYYFFFNIFDNTFCRVAWDQVGIFMKKYQTLKIHTFPNSEVRFKYYSCAFINFHEKYQTFKDHTFPSSDVRFKYYSCAFMNFHEKISNFQSSHFSKFRCEIQLLFMRFHEFSWKNIKLTKFTLFQVQMWDSSIIHALSLIFMKKYQTFKVHTFPSSDVRFKYYSFAFMNFHEKISNF